MLGLTGRIAGLLVLCVVVCQGAKNIVDIECPFPEGQSVASEAECGKYTACEFTDGVCHMKNDKEDGYTVTSDPQDTGRGFKIDIEKQNLDNTMFGADIQKLTFEVIHHESYHVQIKIYDPENQRYEVPVPLNLPESADAEMDYEVVVSNASEPLVFRVIRKSTGVEIFRNAGPLTFEDQFLQFTTMLPSSYLYGLGENPHTSLRHDFKSRPTYPMFGRDQPVGPGEINEYGAHPYYVNIDGDNGETHSVFLFNSNAMEYHTFLMGDNEIPSLTLRAIGGIIDLHFFLGPSPEQVNNQYISMIGLPAFPPYWSLGFQLSRWGYNNTANIRDVRERMKAMGIPQDVQTLDIDYMNRKRDFTFDPDGFGDLPQLIEELHNDNLKVTLILDPALVIDWDNYEPAQRGRDSDVFVKWMSSDLVPADQEPGCQDYVVGYVWPDTKTVFPDFLNPVTQTWWANELKLFFETLKYDAIWIDMNEPANFGTNLDKPWNWPEGVESWSLKCPDNHLDKPPYPTKATYNDLNECKMLSDKTICMSSNQTDGTHHYLHYDVHNLYGWSETVATFKGLLELRPDNRPVVLSRSTYPGSGQYAVHWLGDNSANWQQMHMSIIGMIEFNMFGIPMVGADICGFFDEPDEELCARWMQLGAFYPFSRNHNTLGTADQDPGMWLVVGEVSRVYINLRYKLLPYLYTLFHMAHMHGHTVVRPLFSLDPTDMTARDVDDQFMWDTGIMVAPVVVQGAVSRDVYFPKGTWYDILTGELVTTGPATLNVDAPLDKMPVYVRGGEILATQVPALTTAESRQNPLGFIVALEDDYAMGELFWDSGDEDHDMSEVYMSMFTYDKGNMTLSIMHGSEMMTGLTFDEVRIYGYPNNPSTVTLNGEALDSSRWSYFDAVSVLIVYIDIDATLTFELLIM